jgi:hypothetical protein
LESRFTPKIGKQAYFGLKNREGAEGQEGVSIGRGTVK